MATCGRILFEGARNGTRALALLSERASLAKRVQNAIQVRPLTLASIPSDVTGPSEEREYTWKPLLDGKFPATVCIVKAVGRGETLVYQNVTRVLVYTSPSGLPKTFFRDGMEPGSKP